MGVLLCEEAPDSLRGWARLWGHHLWGQWGSLLESVRTGDGWRKRIKQQEGYEHLNADPGAAALLHDALRSITHIVTSNAALLIDLSTAKRVVDVGGGHGEFLATVLRAWPALHGICVDLPPAAAGARQLLSRAGLESRAEFEAGDFLVSIPSADALLLKSVLHNWDDGKCARILLNCRRALAAGGRLLVVERALPPAIADRDFDRCIIQADLNMLVGVGGRERTLAQYEQMLANAQFELASVHQLPLGFSLLECVAVLNQPSSPTAPPSP
jgi:SAM-dependent methyltransferase